MTDDRDLGRLEGKFEQFEKNCAERDKRLDARLAKLESSVGQILDAANMGKGAWWLVLRVGAIMAAFAAAFWWLVDKVVHLR